MAGAGVVDRLVLEVSSRVDAGARNLPRLLAGIAGAGLAAASAIAGVTLSASRQIDSIGKAGQRAGVAVEKFSALAVAAELADVSLTSLAASSFAYSRQVKEAAEGNERYAEAFRRVGIDAKQALGSGQDFADVLPQILDGLQKIEDPALRAATAQDILGRGAKDLATLIEGGSLGLAEATKFARDYGLAIEKDAFDSSVKLNDSITMLGMRFRGLAFTLGMQMIPAAQRLVDTVADFLDAMRPSALRAIEAVTTNLSRAIDGLTSPLGRATVGVLAFVAAWVGMRNFGGLAGLIKNIPLVGGALSGLAVAAAPLAVTLGPVALVLGLIALALDDVFAFMRGGDSVIGRFAAYFGVESELYLALSAIGDLIDSQIGLFKTLATNLDDIVIAALDRLADNFEGLRAPIEYVRDLFSWMIDNLPSLGSVFNTVASFASRMAVATDRASQIAAGERGVDISDESIAREARQRLLTIDERRREQIANRSENTTNNVNIRVDGAQDPAAVGREVNRQLRRVIGGAAGQVP